MILGELQLLTGSHTMSTLRLLPLDPYPLSVKWCLPVRLKGVPIPVEEAFDSHSSFTILSMAFLKPADLLTCLRQRYRQIPLQPAEDISMGQTHLPTIPRETTS